LCRLKRLPLKRSPIDIGYQCKGKEYDKFGKNLLAFAENATKHDGCCWGQRLYPIPANKTVLMIGNSHTRQVANALVCEYHDQITEIRAIGAEGTVGEDDFAIRFRNNATIYNVCNHEIVHSYKWDKLLERLLNRSLRSLDSVVLGHFNRYVPGSSSQFHKGMLEKSDTNPDVDYANITGPLVDQFANTYAGPIVAIGMFEERKSYLNKETDQLVTKLTSQGREKVVYIENRKYVPYLGECGSDNKSGTSDCKETGGSHRCTGKHGGHPDLIAWDIIETLHEFIDV
jgi:hypothetical protein